ncbi:unnamed protein product [Hymenolepis diminuta]|uniref:Peptidase A2 domain-containing protein n=1 Tax=Hymenolepis diminuta TaxID=6216 RepID=A0A564YC40_HYMDI|nr:unnamed protein product [Hymenolepis diminuta]
MQVDASRRHYEDFCIHGIHIELQVDTGSDTAIISSEAWRTLGSPKLDTIPSKVSSVSSDAEQLSGVRRCEATLKGKSAATVCYVTDRDIDLLGLDWIDTFNVLETKIERGVQHILAKSIRNTPVSAEDIRKEMRTDAVPQQVLKFIQIPYYGHKRKSCGPGYMSISRVRSTPHLALEERFPTEVLMDRKLRTVHEAMLWKKTLPDRKRWSQKNGFAANTPAYARDYRPGRQWTAAIITKRHGSMIYDVEVGKATWARHNKQLRRRMAERTTNKRYLSLYSLLDTFNQTHVLPPRSQVIDQVMVPSHTARIRMKPPRLQVDPSSKIYV